MAESVYSTGGTVGMAEPYLREAENQLLQAYRVLASASVDGDMRVDRLCSRTFTAWNLVNGVMQEAGKLEDSE